MNFKSTSYEWLTVSGTRAQFKGIGSINGEGSYKFMLTAIDDNTNGDRFRIKITDSNDVTVYDNQVNTTDTDGLTSVNTLLGGGSIVIHQPLKGNSKSAVTAQTEIPEALDKTELYNYPNTFSDRTTIAFRMHKSETYALEVYDLRGVLIKRVDMGVADAGKLYEYEFDGKNLAEGMYIARLMTSSGMQSVKMILRK